jgi:hypothetical protein
MDQELRDMLTELLDGQRRILALLDDLEPITSMFRGNGHAPTMLDMAGVARAARKDRRRNHD